jgi:hypothetical protein
MTATSPEERPTALEVVHAAERLRTEPIDGAPPLPPVRAAVAAGIPAAGAADSRRAGEETTGDAPTRRYPRPSATAATVALAGAPAAAGASAASGVSTDRPEKRRSRRPLVIGLAAAAVALITAGSIWAGSLAGSPQPASTDPAQTEPQESAPAEVVSTDPTPTPTPTVTTTKVDPAPDDDAADEAAKDAEKAAKDEQKRAQREANKDRKGPKDKP